MGIMRTAAEIAAKSEKDAQDLLKKCMAFAKKNHIYTGHNEVYFDKGNWIMTIANSNGGGKHGFSEEMSDIIAKHPRAKVIKKEEFDGNYDWPSRTYNEDSSAVTFKFV